MPHSIPIRVWDLPTRLFHWVLAIAIVGSVISAKVGGNAMVWHFRLGYLVGALLVFRLLWGVVGGRWSRFHRFVYGPGSVLRYLQGRSSASDQHEVGHSPIGSLSVFALIGVLVVQVSTGLVADDEISNIGPLNRFFSGDIASTATRWHAHWGQWLVLSLVALHIAAVVFYLMVRKKNLIRPMIVGDKALPADTPASVDTWRTRLLALLLGGASAALVTWVVQLGG